VAMAWARPMPISSCAAGNVARWMSRRDFNYFNRLSSIRAHRRFA
jgi:hypothetical protein